MVLQILTTTGGTMAPSEIAEWTLREWHNVMTLVDRLKQGGLAQMPEGRNKRQAIGKAQAYDLSSLVLIFAIWQCTMMV